MYMHLSGEIYDIDEMVNNMPINFKNTLDKHAPLKQQGLPVRHPNAL